MTEVKHAGGLVSSSKVPALHLIPTEALVCLAERFEVGTARKGDGAWNALTKNQQCLDDNAFLIERCSHIIRHTMLLRDQLAHGYNAEQEDSPYENAGAIIFGGVLMACAMSRRDKCITCGVPFTEAGQVACTDCLKYAYESIGCPMEPAKCGEVRLDPATNRWIPASDWVEQESSEDWVVQDRVPARRTDRGAWVDIGEEYPAYNFSGRHWWTVADKVDKNLEHGSVDAVGRTLHLICRRKDLPPITPPAPAEEEWVDLNQYPDHTLREGIDWIACKSLEDWDPVNGFAGSLVEDLTSEYKMRCLKKDLPPSLVPEPPTETSQSLYPPRADASFMCRNHEVVSGLEFSPAQKMWFWKDRSDVCWDLYGKARRISLDLTDVELRGFDIVKKIQSYQHEE